MSVPLPAPARALSAKCARLPRPPSGSLLAASLLPPSLLPRFSLPRTRASKKRHCPPHVTPVLLTRSRGGTVDEGAVTAVLWTNVVRRFVHKCAWLLRGPKGGGSSD